MAIYNLNSFSSIDVKEDTRQAKTITSVAVTTTAGTLLAANTNRVTYSIYNAGSATAFIREGATVSNTLYEYAIPAGFYFTPEGSEPRYTGIISVVGAAATTLLVGGGRYIMPLTRLSNPIPESQIDSLIARDSEVTSAINSHQAEADPHPNYLTQSKAQTQLFGSKLPHASFTDFNTAWSAGLGFTFVLGSSTQNSPPNSSTSPWSQCVCLNLGIGSNIDTTKYGMQIAFPRYLYISDCFEGLWVRTLENGTWGTWRSQSRGKMTSFGRELFSSTNYLSGAHIVINNYLQEDNLAEKDTGIMIHDHGESIHFIVSDDSAQCLLIAGNTPVVIACANHSFANGADNLAGYWGSNPRFAVTSSSIVFENLPSSVSSVPIGGLYAGADGVVKIRLS